MRAPLLWTAGVKPCTCCGKSAPEVEFGTRLRKGERVQRHWCRGCERESNRLAMRKNRVKVRAELRAAEERVEKLAAELTDALNTWRRKRKWLGVPRTARSAS